MGALHPLAGKLSKYKDAAGNTYGQMIHLFRILEERRRIADELGKYNDPTVGLSYLEGQNQAIMEILDIPIPVQDVSDKLLQSMKTELEESEESRRRLLKAGSKARVALESIVTALQCVKEDTICADIINIANEGLKK